MSAVQDIEYRPVVVRDSAATTSPQVASAAHDAPKFEVLIGKPAINRDEFERFPELEDIGPIEPAYYYEDSGIPVFTPTMDQFRSFKKFVDKINHYGMQSGIVKIIPPKEWTDSLPPLDEKVKDIKIKNPIEQHIQGLSGEYRQTNLEKQRTYNLPEWRRLCDGSEHQPPARRGERRKGQNLPAVKRTTRGRKSAVKVEEDEAEDGVMTKPPTPKSPARAATEGTPARQSTAPEQTPEPALDAHGRQPRKKRIFKTAKQRAADREIADEEAFEGFDFRIQDADKYTPERCEELEKAYWRTLIYNSPLYGADMPGSLFDESTTSWNVAKLENILDCLAKKLPGVNTAYLYLGMWKSTFAWHLEDMDLYSINYIHFGAPKQWYSISRSDKDKFEQVMKGIYPNDARKCTEFLRHKTFLVSPALLAQHGVKVNKLVHHQGEFVITFPFGYHSGYNLGYNCAESVNFATDSWLDFGRNAKKCECVGDSVFVDVDEIERKLRGEPTEDEDDLDDYSDDFDDDDERDEAQRNGDFPTPPESVEGKLANRKPRKRRFGDLDRSRRVRPKPKTPAKAPCILCPNDTPYEQLLPTENSAAMAHRLCAIYTPETYFKYDEVNKREIVANVEEISKDRMHLKCFYCRAKKGSCFQCSAKKCHRAYHATCAAAAGVLVNMVDVSIVGEDGKSYPRTNIDFKCRYHRPKRPKDIQVEQLEEDRIIQQYAMSLIPKDLIQMQFMGGDIFAGVVLDNRKEEATVLVETVPKGEIVEVEWKWILTQDPTETDFPDAITTAPLFPDPDYRPMGRAQPDRQGIPQPGDVFGDSLGWGELITENIVQSPEQQPIDPNKNYWYYLGEQSTESISKFTDNLSKRVPNEAANFVAPRRVQKKPKPPVYREIDYHQYVNHQNGYWQPQGYTPQPGPPRHAGNAGWPAAPGYRPQFLGGSPMLYAPVNTSRPEIQHHQGYQQHHHPAPMAAMSQPPPTTSTQAHAPYRPLGLTSGQQMEQLQRQIPSMQTSMPAVTQSTPIHSPITPATTQPYVNNNYFPATEHLTAQTNRYHPQVHPQYTQGQHSPAPIQPQPQAAAVHANPSPAPANHHSPPASKLVTAAEQAVPVADIKAALAKIAERVKASASATQVSPSPAPQPTHASPA